MSESTYTYYKSETAKVGKGSVILHGTVLGDDVKIGTNCSIGHYTLIQKNAVIKSNTKIGSFCHIGKGVKIGSYVEICQYADIGEGSIVEDYAYIGAGVTFANIKRIAHHRDFEPEVVGAYVERGARIAPRALVLPGVRIGKEALVGSGAVVAKDVPSREIWFGFPAIKRGTVPEAEYLKGVKNVKSI